MDPKEMMMAVLQALASTAGAPGRGPAGADQYTNPYGWSPMTDPTLAPAMQSSPTTAMIGAFAPMLVQMFAPELASRLSSTPGLNRGLANSASHLANLQMGFNSAQNKQQTAVLGQLGFSKSTTDTLSQILPIAGAMIPEIGNMMNRFDVSGTGFGYGGAMMSLVRAGGMSANRVDQSTAARMAEQYAEHYQREGTGLLKGTKVLDDIKTGGMSIAEHAQMTAGLVNRGILQDVFTGNNDAAMLLKGLTPQQKKDTEGKDLTSIENIRKTLGSVGLQELREKNVNANITDPARNEVAKKYAESTNMVGSVFTELAGSTEELLKTIEKLHGPLTNLDPKKLKDTMSKYVELMDQSGLSATELLRGAEVFSARTGNKNIAFALHATAQSASARYAMMGAGATEKQSNDLSSAAADIIGGEATKMTANFMVDYYDPTGMAAYRKDRDTLGDQLASAEDKAAALERMRLGTQYGIKKGLESDAALQAGKLQGGEFNSGELAAMEKRSAGVLNESAAENAAKNHAATVGALGAGLSSAFVDMKRDPNSGWAAARGDVESMLMGNAKVTAADRAKWDDKKKADWEKNVDATTQALIEGSVAAGNGSTADSEGVISAYAAKLGLTGDAAELAKQKMRDSSGADSALRKARNYVGATAPEAAARLAASATGSIAMRDISLSKDIINRDLDEAKKGSNLSTAQKATIKLAEGAGGKMDLAGALDIGLHGLGILKDGRELTDAEKKRINESKWGAEYQANLVSKDTDEVKARKQRMILGDMTAEMGFDSPANAEAALKKLGALEKASPKGGESSTAGESAPASGGSAGGGNSTLTVKLVPTGNLERMIVPDSAEVKLGTELDKIDAGGTKSERGRGRK